MKKRIAITLTALFLVFFSGGIYFITTVEKTTTDLYNLIRLHQVEILREHLAIRVRTVQSGLVSRSSDGKILALDMKRAIKVSDECFGCHHSEPVQKELVRIRNLMYEYAEAVDGAVAAWSVEGDATERERAAYRIGEDLIGKIDAMIAMTGGKLEAGTEAALEEIADTKKTLFLLVLVCALLAAGLAAVFMKSFARPLNTLLQATRRLKSGDLDYRIEGLKDEFREVATSFNDMARSLKAHMDEAEESRKDWEETFDAISDMITIHNSDFEITRANREAVRTLGLSRPDRSSKSSSCSEGTGRLTSKSQIFSFLRTTTPGTFEVFEPHLKRFLEVRSMSRSRNGNGHSGMIHIVRDITERKQTEEAMQRAEQLRGVGEIAAGLAHEIKVPLTGIMMAMESVSGELSLDERKQKKLRQAAEEAKRIQVLLRELLNFAKPPKPQMMAVDLNSLLDSTLSFSINNTAGAIEIVRDFDASHPAVMADPMQMKQVFLNLFVNAVDAMREGGRLSVRSLVDPESGAVRIEVADTGRGIKEESLDNIFQPFFTTKAKGTGLGLAVTKRLIEQHGGTIGVTSLLGAGTVFMVSLPVASPGQKKNGTREEVSALAG